MLSDAERGYLAAMLDGEGSIDWNKDRPRIRVANGDRPLLCSLETSFGGSVNQEPVAKRDGIKRKAAYRWTLSGQRAVDVLVSVRPLLRVKGSIADDVVHRWRHREREKQRAARVAASVSP